VAPSLAGSVELTFDDGPDPVWTPAVLAALSGSALQASFFVIGSRAAEHPQVIAAIRAGGHAVELHCYDHLRHTGVDRATIE
jgi:peptidoglycan/xylan/chitin deacetylase (PgdA/CDA1 family)